MLWTLLSFGIIVVWVAGMMVAAKLAEKSAGQSREALGSCRRGSIKLAGRINPPPALSWSPKGRDEEFALAHQRCRPPFPGHQPLQGWWPIMVLTAPILGPCLPSIGP